LYGDEGGNNLELDLHPANNPSAPATDHGALHGYWDNDAAGTALGLMAKQFRTAHPSHAHAASNDELAAEYAMLQPAAWNLAALPPRDWAQAMADDVLPLAQAAHRRLQFHDITIVNKHGRNEAEGDAVEQAAADGMSYRDWAGKVTLDEIHKGGWRLAALLVRIVP
ncbi:MAG TPA: hypothetical protein VMH83_09360, partial [Candidatus Acidoferrum sp.]|nr:hypothetical protein [Candidatus Acidoferrum sp.]